MNRTENTGPLLLYPLLRPPIGTDRAENAAFQPAQWFVLGMCCLAMGSVHLATGLHARICT
jgi:hypothetical protein